MNFSRIGNCLRVSRITGPSHNILGIEFGQATGPIDVIVDILSPTGDRGTLLAAEDVRQSVLCGVDEANRQFGTDYVVGRIEFVPTDSPPASTYELLAYAIVERVVRELPFEAK